jgi:hypothetical protein
MKPESPLVQEVRQRRMDLSAQFGHDASKYFQFLQKAQQKYRRRLVSQVTVVRPAQPKRAPDKTAK